MEIKKKLKLTKVLFVVVAFTFSISVCATTATSTFTAVDFLAKNKRNKKQKPPRNNRCSSCKQSKCKGHNTSGHKIPLDGGLDILELGAAAFGIKKLRSKKNDIA